MAECCWERSELAVEGMRQCFGVVPFLALNQVSSGADGGEEGEGDDGEEHLFFVWFLSESEGYVFTRRVSVQTSWREEETNEQGEGGSKSKYLGSRQMESRRRGTHEQGQNK